MNVYRYNEKVETFIKLQSPDVNKNAVCHKSFSTCVEKGSQTCIVLLRVPPQKTRRAHNKDTLRKKEGILSDPGGEEGEVMRTTGDSGGQKGEQWSSLEHPTVGCSPGPSVSDTFPGSSMLSQPHCTQWPSASYSSSLRQSAARLRWLGSSETVGRCPWDTRRTTGWC